MTNETFGLEHLFLLGELAMSSRVHMRIPQKGSIPPCAFGEVCFADVGCGTGGFELGLGPKRVKPVTVFSVKPEDLPGPVTVLYLAVDYLRKWDI